MDIILRELCRVHDLTTISVMVQPRFNSVTVYPHWDEDGIDRCVSRTGKTFDEAIAGALVEVSTHRSQAAIAKATGADHA